MVRIHRTILLVSVLWGINAQAKILPYQISCNINKPYHRVQQVQGAVITVSRNNGVCRVSVKSTTGESLLDESAYGIQVSQVMPFGQPLNDSIVIQIDGNPDTVYVLSLGSHPSISATIKNGYGFWLQDGCTPNRWYLWTADAAFQGDPELIDIYHFDVIVPEVALDLANGKLVDVTPLCKPLFDRRIAQARKQLSPGRLSQFKKGIGSTESRNQTKGELLSIAFAYLYTGRAKEARKVVEDFWPNDKRDEVFNWMSHKRAQGITSKLLTISPLTSCSQ
ncbi:MAG TPA: hypothetical protein VFB79_09365 [Candidatus Angelobacter sp.]|nr:hypothetical protein [Candidatus Angelobacter sp.]